MAYAYWRPQLPKILLLDIETSPNVVYTWSLFKPTIGTNQIIQSGAAMCWAAKWLGKKEIMFRASWEVGEKRMLKEIHKLLDEADIVVHYNGRAFDIPKLNKDFVRHGMKPPAPYKQIDMLQVVRDNFAFVSKKMDYVAASLNLGQKVAHEGFTLWVDTMNGIRSAQRKMKKYNIHDVRLLERLYLRLRPWIKNHPNISVFTDGITCPFCGAKNTLQHRGTYVARTRSYQRFHCTACGGWPRGTQMLRGARVVPAGD